MTNLKRIRGFRPEKPDPIHEAFQQYVRNHVRLQMEIREAELQEGLRLLLEMGVMW